MMPHSSPYFFLPGWCLGRGPWRPVAEALGGEILDLPGYGGQPLSGSFIEAAKQLAARLPENAQVCGWSLGAMLALAAAVLHPGKFRRLVLVSGTASFIQREGWPHALPPEMLEEFNAAIASDAQAMLPRFVGGFNRGDARAGEITRQILALADPLPAPEVLAAGLRWLSEADLRLLAPQLACPTLLLHGAADPLMPPAAARALAAMIPNARLSVFESSAHAVFLSDPQGFQDRLKNFGP